MNTWWTLHTLTMLIHLSLDGHFSSAQQCKSSNGVPGFKLRGSLITTRTSGFENCVLKCIELANCYSINHCSTTDICELNNKTRIWTTIEDFHAAVGCFYMEILERQFDPCLVENPCTNGATCSSVLSTGKITCHCKKGFTGKTCEYVEPPMIDGNYTCNNQTWNLGYSKTMFAWRFRVLGPTIIELIGCTADDVTGIQEMLLFVSRSTLEDYGKYEIVRVIDINGCNATLPFPLKMTITGSPCELTAQRIPYFDKMALTQSCMVYSRASDPGNFGKVGSGILAFRANNLLIDSTSKIDVTGKGFRKGVGGSGSGGGGFGGETFSCSSSDYGKGGDKGQIGNAGGGGGDGRDGGPGGLNAGGGGGSSKTDGDEGGGGGGGGGHFSGGGGGGGATGCHSYNGGSGGSASSTIGAFAGGGGTSSCPGGSGGGSGSRGGESGGLGGTSSRGGGGGGSISVHYGGGGGGGGMQFGNLDYKTRLSMGGGGGGGGGVDISSKAGGRGGSGGGLVLILVKTLTLHGTIHAQGEWGQCPENNANYRGGAGGSGAGGSVLIYADNMSSSVAGKILVSGGGEQTCYNFIGAGRGGAGGTGRYVVVTPSGVVKSD